MVSFSILTFFSSMLLGAGVIGEGGKEVPSSPAAGGGAIDIDVYL